MSKARKAKKPVNDNARKTSVHFTMRMPRELSKALKAAARSRKMTAAQVVAEALGIARTRWQREISKSR